MSELNTIKKQWRLEDSVMMYPKEWRRKSHPRLLYTVNLSFKKEDKIWIFLDKGGKKEFEEFFIWASRSETLKLVFLDLKQVMKDSNTHGKKKEHWKGN